MTAARAALAAAAALLARAAAAAPLPEQGYGLPRDASVHGGRVDWLLWFTTVAGVVIFALVGAVLVWSLVRHGRRHEAAYDHGSRRSVALVVGFVAGVLVIVDGTLFVHALDDMRSVFWNFAAAEAAPGAVRIQVEAHQWAWQGRYPGPDGRFATEDDVVTLNDLRVPAGAPVVVQLSSVDVIHSLALPHFRVKQDAVPGSITRLTFTPAVEGEFEIACAQHCGANHYKMRGVLTVLPRERWQAWLRAAEEDARRAYDPDDAEAHWGWDWRRAE